MTASLILAERGGTNAEEIEAVCRIAGGIEGTKFHQCATPQGADEPN
jgi:hypothetical protein